MRSAPDFNYYVLGPKGFGPFTFPVGDDSQAEREFRRWIAGDPDVEMSYGMRFPGRYTLWRQPIPWVLRPSKEFFREWDEQGEDELVAAEDLGPRFPGRPPFHHTDFYFAGQVAAFHDETEAVEDIWACDPQRADRILVYGVYGTEPTVEKDAETVEDLAKLAEEVDDSPTWMTWLSTTIPVYAPDGGLLDQVAQLVGRPVMRHTTPDWVH